MKKLLTTLFFTLNSLFFTLCNAQYTVLSNFSTTDAGANPDGSLIPSTSGDTLYGMTVYGGKFDHGSMFYITSDGLIYDTLHSFTGGADGEGPSGDLTLSGNILYGMTQVGGTNNFGTIFSFNLSTGTLNILHEFASGTGNPQGDLTLLNGILYGLADNRGANNAGMLFSLNTGGSNYTVLHSFGSGADDGTFPVGSLTPSPEGDTLYGMTGNGGQHNNGNIFSFIISGNIYDTLHSFGSGNDGSYPQGSLTLSGNVLYGMASGGGINNAGNIFSINTDGTGYKNLFGFSTATGYDPFGEVTLVGNTLYGMASEGGANSNGVIFSINTNGTGYDTLHNFDDPYGREPQGALTLSDTLLYGMTFAGGSYNYGVFFSYGIVNNITASATDTISCYGGNNGNAIATPKGGVAPYTYSWSNGGTAVVATTNPTGSVLNAGIYTVTITDTKGTSATTAVTITQPAAITVITDSTAVVGSTLGSASVTPSGGTAPYTYLWSANANSQTTASISGLSVGTYTCTITDNHNCDDIVSVTINNVTGINTTSSTSPEISIYPNPSIGIMNGKLSMVNENAELDVYNVLGEKVYSQLIIDNSQFTIDLSSQPYGIYLYRVLTQNGSLLGEGKLIIQK